jgi:hypothetical protein
MNRTEEISQKLAEGLELEEKRLLEDVERCQKRFDKYIGELEVAKKNLPLLKKKIEQKQLMLNQISNEITLLEEEAGRAENIIDGSVSQIANRLKIEERELASAKYKAKVFVENKIKEIVASK